MSDKKEDIVFMWQDKATGRIYESKLRAGFGLSLNKIKPIKTFK